MGVDVIALRALAFGKRLGLLQFDQTVTLGRQQIFFAQSDYDQLVKMSVLRRAELSASYFAEPLLKSFDATVVESIDASDYEGASIIADFNKPLGDQHHGRFTSFIDFGTMEHIFDPHRVLLNINKLLQRNGTALILANANGFFGHGFYQFSPEFFYSALTQKNGFSQTVVILIDYNRPKNWYYIKSPAVLRDRNQAPNKHYFILCFTRKIETVDSIDAQQSDYENMLWTQKGYRYVTNHKRGIKSLMGRLIWRLSPTIGQELGALSRSISERRIFAQQVVTFNPERVSREQFKAICC